MRRWKCCRNFREASGPLAAHRVQHLQQQSPQQLLRRNRRTAHLGIHLGELWREFLQDLIYHRADRPQRMIFAYPLLR